jgi:hypothetical protein
LVSTVDALVQQVETKAGAVRLGAR